MTFQAGHLDDPRVGLQLATWYPHPPRVIPHPLSFPGGGGEPSLGQPKIFRCVSLCCCVDGCVVGHYHLHPLHSWQDILLTFAEMELDSTTMFPPRTSVMFIRSTGEPVLAQVVGHSEHGDAYRRISYDRDGKTVLHDRASVRRLSLPRAPPPPRPAQSDSGSVISSTDDDSSGGALDAPDNARHANGGAESDVSSLTSAEELPDAPTTDDDSDLNSDTEVVWVKSARGVWGMGHSFGNKLYFTRDIPEGKWVPKNLLAPAKPPTKKAKPPPKSAAQSIPVESGEHVQEFKVKWSRTKKFYTEPVKE